MFTRIPARRTASGIVGAAAIAATLTFGVSGLAPEPVAAAASSVKACFYYTSNGAAAVSAPIQLQRWWNGGWRLQTSGKTGSTGCGTFGGQWTVAGGYYRIVLNQKVGAQCYPSGGIWMAYGESGYGTATSGGTLNLGWWPADDGWVC